VEDVSSDEENLESGAFLEMVKQETDKAMKERHFLMKDLRAKERRGSIFIDKVKRVVAAVQRSPGKFDYLIEWDYHVHDKITPSTTLVRGSHFAFSNPLLYRRYVEANFVEIANNNGSHDGPPETRSGSRSLIRSEPSASSSITSSGGKVIKR